MYKAVFIDMDGTLLEDYCTISKASQKIIKYLLDLGIYVIPVSARPLHGMMPVLKPVIDESMPMVSLNGSYLYYKNEIINDVRISISNTIKVYQAIKNDNVTPIFYNQMEWYSDRNNEIVQKEQRITPVQIVIKDFEALLDHWEKSNHSPNKIVVVGDENTIKEVQAKLRILFEDQLNIYTSDMRYLEIMDLQASKKTGVEILVQKLGLKPEEIIALGDHFNDKDMLQFAGMGIAMGNAPDDIKAIANYITDTNKNDGFAKALKYFFY
ncbi:MAG: HAD family phosphatase [Chitinophagaceae bacterium]|nr:MAG: HAD family phosphatase [Chitinophagaceae bacterium]